jgi:hypothetical protein
MMDAIQVMQSQVGLTCIKNERKDQAIENRYHHPPIKLNNMVEHTNSQHHPSDRRAISPSREFHQPASPQAMSDIGSGPQEPLALELDRSRGTRVEIWWKFAFFVFSNHVDLLLHVATGVYILGFVTPDLVLKPPLGV